MIRPLKMKNANTKRRRKERKITVRCVSIMMAHVSE